MASVRIPLLLGTSGGTPLNSTPQRVYNYYPMAEPGAKASGAWKNTPGWDTWITIANENIRHIRAFKGNLYAICDRNVYRISADGATTLVGSMREKGTRIFTAEDGISLVFTNGARMYGTFRNNPRAMATINNRFPAPTGVVFHNGHFIAIEGGTGKFYISDKFLAFDWDSLQFATAEDQSDDIVALGSDRALLVFGTSTTQVYNNTGGLFPFTPNPQGRAVYGMVGSTWALVGNSSYWLSANAAGGVKVIRSTGLQVVSISTPFIENEFSKLDATRAFAISIMWEGREWYVLTFPDDSRTFVYDVQGAWFEWGDYDADTGEYKRHPMTSYAYYNNRHLFVQGDGAIRELKRDVYKHGEGVMSSMFVTGVTHLKEKRIFLRSIILDMRTGTGGSAELSISLDGGYTYGSWQAIELGRVGEFGYRAQWHRLGSGYNIVIRMRITDEIPREIINGIVDVDMALTTAERAIQFRLGN